MFPYPNPNLLPQAEGTFEQTDKIPACHPELVEGPLTFASVSEKRANQEGKVRGSSTSLRSAQNDRKETQSRASQSSELTLGSRRGFPYLGNGVGLATGNANVEVGEGPVTGGLPDGDGAGVGLGVGVGVGLGNGGMMFSQ